MDAKNPSGPSSDSVDAALLRRALVALELADELVSVIRLVDWWIQRALPPIDALLAKARALIVIGQVDRSWQVLRELSVAHPRRVDVKLLTARMFIERGWSARASRLIDDIPGLGQDDPRVRLLKDQLHQPFSEVPANAGDIARNGSVLERLTLAKQYLLSGNQIRARTLLERLRLEQVEPKVVGRMLFGIQGDVDDASKTQSDMLMELLGWSKMALSKIDSTDLEMITDLGEFDSVTAEVSKSSRVALSVERQAFPALFRSLPALSEAENGDAELTQASVLDELDDGMDPPTEEALIDEVQDTQIMEVIGSAESMKIQQVEVGFRPSAMDKPQNPREWAGDTTIEEVDEEDDEVIVMTRPNQPVEAVEVVDSARGPIKVLEKFPSPPHSLRAPSKIETIELPAYRGRLDEPTVELDSWEDDEVDDYIRYRQHRGIRNLSFLILLCVIGWVVWSQVLTSNISEMDSGNRFYSDARQLILDGDLDGIRVESNRIAQMIREDESLTGGLAVEWALLQSFHHSDWTGSVEEALQVEEIAEMARVSGSKSTDLALLNANLLWRQGDLKGAAASLNEAGEGAFQDYLGLRIAFEQQGEMAPDWRSVVELTPPILAALALHRPTVFEPQELSALLDEQLASMAHTNTRLHSHFLVARARLAFSRSDLDQGWLEAAVEMDPSSAEVLLLEGELAWAEGRMGEAATHFEKCLESRYSDVRCIRGAVATAYEMDRLEDAQWAVNHWPADSELHEDIQCWMADLRGTTHCGTDQHLDTGEGRFVADLIRLQLGKKPLNSIGEMIQTDQLHNDFSPLQHALIERFKTLHAINIEESSSKSESAEGDPWVALARLRDGEIPTNLSFGKSGALARQKRARVMFEYAELIRPLYPERSAEVSARYLDQLPTGPRAKKVKDSWR